MSGQKGFGDEEQRLKKLERKKPSLELSAPQYHGKTSSTAGEPLPARAQIQPVAKDRRAHLFKMLVLQQLHNLSDGELDSKSMINPLLRGLWAGGQCIHS